MALLHGVAPQIEQWDKFGGAMSGVLESVNTGMRCLAYGFAQGALEGDALFADRTASPFRELDGLVRRCQGFGGRREALSAEAMLRYASG